MIRLFRWVGIVGCAMSLMGLLIAVCSCVELLVNGTGIIFPGAAGQFRGIFEAIGLPLLTLTFSAALYVLCDIATSLRGRRNLGVDDD
jgi:hypothetical protein